MSIARRIMTAAAIAGLFCVALAGTAVAALTHPQPLFSYHAEYGRLSLYSDRPFDVGCANQILADVERRLSHSSLMTTRTGFSLSAPHGAAVLCSSGMPVRQASITIR